MADKQNLKKNVESDMEDNEKTKEEYKKSEQRAGSTLEYVELAGQVANNLRDTKWVKKLYKKAAEKVRSIADLRKIARAIPVDLKDKEFAEEIYLRALERTRSKEEYIMYAQLIAIFLKDSRFSRKLCENIEAIFLPKRTLDEHYKNLINALNGLTAQQKMERFAAFLKKYKMNKHMKDIYFKAAKEFASINKREAMIAYLKYYQLSFREESKPEPIPDRVKKTIFKNEMEYEVFMEVIEVMRRDNDLAAALTKIDDRYRKKIELNGDRIAGIKSRHAVTVDKLGEILNDTDAEKAEVEKRIETKVIKNASSIDWNPIQRELLTLFDQHDYGLFRHEMEDFARCKNVFESQLINGINELFFDVYDDTLILEEEEQFTINPEYRGSAFLKEFLSNESSKAKSGKG